MEMRLPLLPLAYGSGERRTLQLVGHIAFIILTFLYKNVKPNVWGVILTIFLSFLFLYDYVSMWFSITFSINNKF